MASDSPTDPKFRSIRLGRLGRPHGIRGEIKLDFWGEDPRASLALAPLFLELPRPGARAPALSPTRVIDYKKANKGLILRLEGVESREAAAALAGRYLTVSRATLPAAAEGEIYLADLIGMSVYTEENGYLGQISHFLETAGPVLVILSPQGTEIFLPWEGDHVARIEQEEGRLVVAESFRALAETNP
ncbi:MAG: ribosome maturation factor RimM [Deltaproteobacteria bacterium]|jgi:16S rRNA processing protein RimM|nr:ribosome maturation factor RimM [Deltaproteobacteria bacterium]